MCYSYLEFYRGRSQSRSLLFFPLGAGADSNLTEFRITAPNPGCLEFITCLLNVITVCTVCPPTPSSVVIQLTVVYNKSYNKACCGPLPAYRGRVRKKNPLKFKTLFLCRLHFQYMYSANVEKLISRMNVERCIINLKMKKFTFSKIVFVQNNILDDVNRFLGILCNYLPLPPPPGHSMQHSTYAGRITQTIKSWTFILPQDECLLYRI